MDTERWRRARALFDRLVDLPAATWPSELLAACPDDAETRDEVLALLSADAAEAGGDTLPVLAAYAPQAAADLAERIDQNSDGEHAGLRLGPFRLIREIGRGGMGAVWLAERCDGAFEQRVAIKLLRSSWDHRSGLQRFEAERRILAGLQHPNIAHLIDGGVGSGGKPWLALEYVDGEDLLKWCDHRRLGVDARLRLLLDVCAAIAHAHQRLVVHRDLKPSNILVGRDGTVKLLDFGIAKLLDGAEHEATATRVFTPEYAAPEQVTGAPLTTSVDVYALGLLLHELLAGRRAQAADRAGPAQEPSRPSSAVARSDAAAEIATQRESTPRRLRRALQGDLDAIALKALRSDPAQRYASVGELAADLQRHLRNQPVQARRGSWRYRGGRFARRHRWVLAASAAGVLALVAGLGVALWQAREARTQRDTAQQALAFMTDLFRNADPGERGRADLGARDLLDEGARSIRHALAGQDEARARLLLAITSAYLALTLPDPAEPLLAEAERIVAAGDDPLLRGEAALLRCTLLIYREHANDCTPVLQRTDAFLDERDPEQAALIARGLYLRARGLLLSNRHEEIVAYSRRALGLLDDKPTRRELRAELIDTLAFSLVKLDRPAEAEAALRPLVAELAADGDAPRALAEAQDTLAGALFAQKRNDEGLQLRIESLHTLESLYGADHPVLIDNLINLGIAHYRAGRLEPAENLLERAVAAARKAGAAHATALLAALTSLGTVEFVRGGGDADARAHLDEAVALADNLKRPMDGGRSLRWRAILSLAEGHYAPARADLEHSRDLLAPLYPAEHVTMLTTHTLLLAAEFAAAGTGAGQRGRCEEADSLDRQFTTVAGENDPDARVAHVLAQVCPQAPAQAAVQLQAFGDALPADDYRRRLLRTIAQGWAKPLQAAAANAPEPATTPASR